MVSLKNGSPRFQIDLFLKHKDELKGFKEPYLDNFTYLNHLYSIKNYKTDITMVHYIDLDSQRHEFGFNSKEAKEALLRHDKRLGGIIEAVEEEGDLEETVFVILGDHSSLDAEKIIFLNTLFKNKGLITIKNDKISNYEVYGKEIFLCLRQERSFL